MELLKDAQWIGSKEPSTNLYALTSYRIDIDYEIRSCQEFGFFFAARDKENYCKLEINHESGRVFVKERCDNQWVGNTKEGGIPSFYALGDSKGYIFKNDVQRFHVELEVERCRIRVSVNQSLIVDDEMLPKDIPFQPRKRALMSVGFDILGTVYLKHLCVQDRNGKVVVPDTIGKKYSVLAVYGTMRDDGLILENLCEMIHMNPALYFRYQLKKEDYAGHKVELTATARGLYYIYVNGRRLGTEYYAPGFTDYRLRMLCQKYEITENLNEDITILAEVSPGYYTGFLGYSGPMIYGEENTFIGAFTITDQAGRETVIPTDEQWDYTQLGPVIHADFLDGENYDARRMDDLTCRADIWSKVGIRTYSTTVQKTNIKEDDKDSLTLELMMQREKGARKIDTLDAIGVCENPQGHYVFDLGQNMVGTICVWFQARRGQSFRIRYGEMCYPNGEIYIRNIRSAYGTDTYICARSSVEEYCPIHTSHGFRYVEISGNGCEISREQIVKVQGIVICNVDTVTGGFSCSNPLINQLQKNILWGQMGNFLLVPTDCPQRNERMGWTGDIQVFVRTAAHNMDVKNFLGKWLMDLRDSQKLYNKDGAVPDTAPLGGDNRSDGCAGWGDAAVIVPWELYVAYGDDTILRDNYEMMKAWVEYQSMNTRQNCGIRVVDGIARKEQSDLSSQPFLQVQQRRGDHLTFDETTPFILSATAYAAHVSNLLAKTATILGQYEDARKYQQRFIDIRTAFQEAWVKEDGTLGYWGEMSKNGKDSRGNTINETYYSNQESSSNHPSQTAYALAIDFDLIPKEQLQGAKRGLQIAVLDTKYHISTGFLGISHLHFALSKVGLWEEAFRLLEQEENPGWLYSVVNGATTIWERWDSYIAKTGQFGDVSMNSFNHYSYGAIGAWMYECVLGIRPSSMDKETGYRVFYLEPHVGGTLRYAKGFQCTDYGQIDVEWKVQENIFHYECNIPEGTQAIFTIPEICVTKDSIIVPLSSGKHSFQYQINRDKLSI